MDTITYYHVTAAANVNDILRDGLQPASRRLGERVATARWIKRWAKRSERTWHDTLRHLGPYIGYDINRICLFADHQEAMTWAEQEANMVVLAVEIDEYHSMSVDGLRDDGGEESAYATTESIDPDQISVIA